MKRAWRILFHAAAAVLGVLFLIAVGLWVASYGAQYEAERDGVEISWRMTVSRGEVCAEFLTDDHRWNPAVWPVPTWIWGTHPPSDLFVSAAAYLDGRTPVAGFFVGGRTFDGLKLNVLYFPLALLVFLSALLPLADLFVIRPRHRRRRRSAAGLCVRCGYDLRASPDRCPECGAVPAAANST